MMCSEKTDIFPEGSRHMLNLDKLLINYTDSPSGVERKPVIGWKLSSDRQNVTQH